jgi:hypothetical protein
MRFRSRRRPCDTQATPERRRRLISRIELVVHHAFCLARSSGKIQQTGQVRIVSQNPLAHENQVVVALARSGAEKEIGTQAIDQR